MAQLSGGVRLGALRAVGAGALVLARYRVQGCGDLAGLLRSVVLVVGKAGRVASNGARALAGGRLDVAKALVFVRTGCAASPVAWRSGARAAWSGSLSLCDQGRRVVISPGGRRVSVLPWKVASGPGVSAGELAYALPDAWAAWPLPSGYIGEALLLAALARGEPWGLVSGGVQVGGRVLIDQYGAELLLNESDVNKWLKRQLLTVEKMLGAVWMAAGDARNEALSDMRAASWADVRKRAKSLSGVADTTKRAALSADLDFLQRAV